MRAGHGAVGLRKFGEEPFHFVLFQRHVDLDSGVAGDGSGNAAAITRFELGPKEGDKRRVVLEWEEPRVYTNVEPGRRRVEGIWRGSDP